MRYQKNGRDLAQCRICKCKSAIIRKYKLYLCRQCIVEHKKELGWD